MDAWIDGKFVDWQKVKVSPLSHGFSRGVSIFEVALISPTADGPSIFMGNEHLERFYNSAKLMHMELPMSREELVRAIMETAKRNRVEHGVLKYNAFYSSIDVGLLPHDRRVSLVIYCGNNQDFGFDPEHASRPQDAAISSYMKMHFGCVPIKAKVTGNYVGAYLAAEEMAAKGAQIPIFLDAEGYVTEGSTQSHFFVKDGVIRTAPLSRILAGTTRHVVIELARAEGLTVLEEDIRPEDLAGMDEAFSASSVSKIAPFKSIDGRSLGEECPGPVTAQVMAAMEKVYANQYPGFEKYHVLIK